MNLTLKVISFIIYSGQALIFTTITPGYYPKRYLAHPMIKLPQTFTSFQCNNQRLTVFSMQYQCSFLRKAKD